MGRGRFTEGPKGILAEGGRGRGGGDGVTGGGRVYIGRNVPVVRESDSWIY